MLAFVQDQPPQLRLGHAYAWYLLGYLPLLGLFGLVEGSIQGSWGWSAAEWQYQFDGFLVFAVGALLAGGVVSVPLHLMLVRALAPRTTSLTFGVLAPASAFLVLGVLGFGWLYMLSMPASFLLAAAIFGYFSARHFRRASPPPA